MHSQNFDEQGEIDGLKLLSSRGELGLTFRGLVKLPLRWNVPSLPYQEFTPRWLAYANIHWLPVVLLPITRDLAIQQRLVAYFERLYRCVDVVQLLRWLIHPRATFGRMRLWPRM